MKDSLQFYEGKSIDDFLDVAKAVFSDDLKDFEYKKIRNDARKKGFPLQSLLSLPEFLNFCYNSTTVKANSF